MRKANRLKDILIDHVFDHCFNEVVRKIESPGFKITYEDPKELEDPLSQSIIESIKKSGKLKFQYTTRDNEFCKVLVDDNTVHKSLITKLEALGFKKGKHLYRRIEKAHNELVAKSYLVRNKPIENEVKLTEKGLKHYLDGKSFEDKFITRRNSNIALIISIISIVVALTALWMNK